MTNTTRPATKAAVIRQIPGTGHEWQVIIDGEVVATTATAIRGRKAATEAGATTVAVRHA